MLQMVMKLLYWIDVGKLAWTGLSINPYAIELLKENLDKIDWYRLSSNPNAIELLKENPNKINWCGLSKNSYIFEKVVAPVYKEELIATVFHPSRFARYLYEFDFDMNDL